MPRKGRKRCLSRQTRQCLRARKRRQTYLRQNQIQEQTERTETTDHLLNVHNRLHETPEEMVDRKTTDCHLTAQCRQHETPEVTYESNIVVPQKSSKGWKFESRRLEQKFLQFCNEQLDLQEIQELIQKKFDACRMDYKTSCHLLELISLTQAKMESDKSKFYVYLRDFLKCLNQQIRNEEKKARLESVPSVQNMLKRRMEHESSSPLVSEASQKKLRTRDQAKTPTPLSVSTSSIDCSALQQKSIDTVNKQNKTSLERVSPVTASTSSQNFEEQLQENVAGVQTSTSDLDESDEETHLFQSFNSFLNDKIVTESFNQTGSVPPVCESSVLYNSDNENDVQDIEYLATSTAEDFDSMTQRGIFGWESIGGVNVPCIFRGEKKFLAVRIVQTKLWRKFLEDVYEDRLQRKIYSVTQAEATLLNEINREHCGCQYGRESFTTKERIVGVDWLKKIYNEKHSPQRQIKIVRSHILSKVNSTDLSDKNKDPETIHSVSSQLSEHETPIIHQLNSHSINVETFNKNLSQRNTERTGGECQACSIVSHINEDASQLTLTSPNIQSTSKTNSDTEVPLIASIQENSNTDDFISSQSSQNPTFNTDQSPEHPRIVLSQDGSSMFLTTAGLGQECPQIDLDD